MKEISAVLISFLIIFALLVSVHGSWSEYSFYYAKYNTIFIDSNVLISSEDDGNIIFSKLLTLFSYK